MKINYDSNTKNERDLKVGDVIYDTDGNFYLVSEVAIYGKNVYTLINLEGGRSLRCTNTISELQQAYYDNDDRILNGTFKYTDSDK